MARSIYYELLSPSSLNLSYTGPHCQMQTIPRGNAGWNMIMKESNYGEICIAEKGGGQMQ